VSNEAKNYLWPTSDESGLTGEDFNRHNRESDDAFCEAMNRAIARGKERSRPTRLRDCEQ
jgi:hypothetical protein